MCTEYFNSQQLQVASVTSALYLPRKLLSAQSSKQGGFFLLIALEGLFKVVNMKQMCVTGTERDLNPSRVGKFHRTSMVLNESSCKQPS